MNLNKPKYKRNQTYKKNGTLNKFTNQQVNADLCMPIAALPEYLDSRPQLEENHLIRISASHDGPTLSPIAGSTWN